MKIDNNFAKANGYKTVSEMFKGEVGCGEIVKELGRVPEWLRVTEDGGFFIEMVQKEYAN